MERSRTGNPAAAETSKAALWAALIRVASKGVYAGGGSIADGRKSRNPRRTIGSARKKDPPSLATAGE
jgi:hypothetical protein